MKKTIFSLLITAISFTSVAQKKTTTSAIIAFDATTAIDNLPKAENKTAIAALDTKTGDVQFEAAIKNFAFANPKIQEHFNSSGWMDSDQFPVATFKGRITQPDAVNYAKSGTYSVSVEGELTIHGQTQKITAPATLVISGNSISASSDFIVKLADFGVNGPAVGAGKVSKEPKVSVKADFQ
jgi:polyisoprenoid-binding protein YceI